MLALMGERRFKGLILDFFGVLTSNMVEVIELFEDAERLKRGTFLRAWAGDGRELFRRLELGEITQQEWNVGYAELLSVDPANLMGRYLADAWPAYEVINAAKQARAAGIKTAVLSNSLGRSPYDPYAVFNLYETFDSVVLSNEVGLRKPDARIFQLVLDRLELAAEECVFADDTEENLEAAVSLGFTPLFALDPAVVAQRIRMVFDLPDL